MKKQQIRAKLKAKQKKQQEIQNKLLQRLNRKEQKIFLAIKRVFPATSNDAAYDAAIQGGVKFQFISK